MILFPALGVLGFPEIEIERKPQRNFQADFVKLVLEHKGDPPEERRSCELAQGLALLGCFPKLGAKGLPQEIGFLKMAGLWNFTCQGRKNKCLEGR